LNVLNQTNMTNGVNGYHLKNGGIILHIMVLPKCHPMRLFMEKKTQYVVSYLPVTTKVQEVDINIIARDNILCTL
jgi:hypothetical protein